MKNTITKRIATFMAIFMCFMFVAAPVQALTTEGLGYEQDDISGLVATITVAGITEDGVTVKAYQLVDGYYNDNSLVRYVLTDPANGHIANIEAPTADEIIAIANNIGADNFEGEVISMTKNDEGNYVADVEPGMYLVIVSGASDTVFNPAIVSVNVSDANNPVKVTDGSVSLENFFDIGDTAAYVKSSKSDIDKNIVNGESVVIGKGDTVAVGDVIHFEIDDMTIPSFSHDYEAPKYIITDVLEAGKFEAITNLKVFINGVETEAAADTFVLTNNGTDFVVDFTETFLRNHASDASRPTVKITYDSKLIDASGVNFAENFNHVELQYSNDANDQTSMKEIVKNTYHYTFAIDGLLDDTATEGNDDINKIEYAMKGEDTENKRYELAGAKFAISMNEDMSESFAESTSDEFGRFVFTGLDEGVYYIKEVDAPFGYTLNDNVYRVTIDAVLDSATGIMSEYSMKFESKASNELDWTETGKMTYTNDVTAATVEETGDVVNQISVAGTTTDVVNSKIWQLPSSGGTGIAVALGVSAIMAFATIGLVVIAKKKENQ